MNSGLQRAVTVSYDAEGSVGGGRKRPGPAIFLALLFDEASLDQVRTSLYLVRAFVKPRQLPGSQAELARKLASLEKSVATLDASTRGRFVRPTSRYSG